MNINYVAKQLVVAAGDVIAATNDLILSGRDLKGSRLRGDSVIHYKFVPIVLDLLRATCRSCGEVFIPENKIARYKKTLEQVGSEEGLAGRRAKIKEIIKKLKTRKKCPHCNKKQEKISLEKPTTFYEGENKLSPIEIRARMERK